MKKYNYVLTCAPNGYTIYEMIEEEEPELYVEVCSCINNEWRMSWGDEFFEYDKLYDIVAKADHISDMFGYVMDKKKL